MSALFITSFIASRQGYDRVGKFIDLTRFDALVDDFNRPWSGYHLREAIENARVNPRHLLLAGEIRPATRRKHQQISRRTLIEELAARLVERRKPLVGERDDLMARDKGPPCDLAFTLADARRDQHRAMGGFLKQCLATLAKRRGLESRRPVFQNAPLRIASVGEEAARALHLKNRRSLEKMVVADRGEVANQALPQFDRQIAQDRKEFRVRALLPQPSRVVGEIGELIRNRRFVKENRVDVAFGKEWPRAFQPWRNLAPRLL